MEKCPSSLRNYFPSLKKTKPKKREVKKGLVSVRPSVFSPQVHSAQCSSSTLKSLALFIFEFREPLSEVVKSLAS